MPYYEEPINRYINPFYLDVYPDVRVEMEARAGAYAAEVRSTNTKSISWPYQKMPWAHITAYYWENNEQKQFKIGFEDDKLSHLNSNERGKLLLYGEQRNQPKYPLVTGIDISNQGLRGSLLKGKFSFTFFPELTLQGFELETMQRVLFTPGNEVQISFGWSEYAEVKEVNKLEFKGIIYGFNWSFNSNLSISAEVDIVSATTVALGLSGDQSVIEQYNTDTVILNDPLSTEIKGINLISVIDKDLAVNGKSLEHGKIDYLPKDTTPSKLLDYVGICLPSSEIEELEQLIVNYTGSDAGGIYDIPPDSNGTVDGDTDPNAKPQENEQPPDPNTLPALASDFSQQHFYVDNTVNYAIKSKRGADIPGSLKNQDTIKLPKTEIGKSTILILKIKPNFDKNAFTKLEEIATSEPFISYGNWSLDNAGTYRVLDVQRKISDFKIENTQPDDALARAGFIPKKRKFKDVVFGGGNTVYDFQESGEQEYYVKIAYMPKRSTESDKAKIAFRFQFFNNNGDKFDEDEWVSIFIDGSTKPIARSADVNFGNQKINTNSQVKPISIKVDKQLGDGVFSRIHETGYYIDGEYRGAFNIVKFENNTKKTGKPSEDVFFIQFSPKTVGDKEAVLRIRIENFDDKGQFQTTTFLEKRLVGRAVKTDAEMDSFESGIKKETDASVDPNSTNNTPIETAAPDGTTPDGTTPTDPNSSAGTTEPIVVRDKTFWYVRLGSLVDFANVLVSRFASQNADKDLFDSLFTMQAFNNETQYNPKVKSANPIDVYFPDAEMGRYGSIQPFATEKEQFLRQFGRFNKEKGVRETRVEANIINIGNILIGVDVIKRIYATFIDEGGKNISFKNITKFFDEILGLVSSATGDIYELTSILFDEPERLINLPFSYGVTDKRQRAILSIEDTNLSMSATKINGVDTVVPFWFDATVIRPLLRNVTIVSRPSKEMASAAYIAARGGTSLLANGKEKGGVGIVNLDNQLNLGNYTNEKEYMGEFIKTLAELKDAEMSLAQAGWNSNWSELYRGLLIKYKRLAAGVPNDMVQDAHWLNRAIYPIEFSATIDGINGFKFGDVLKTSLIPKHYNEWWDVSFTVTKITHKVTPSTWETTLQTAARLSQYAPGYFGNIER